MIYKAKNYKNLIGIKGLSKKLLENHFALYEGYVKNANLLMKSLAQGEVETPKFAELKRRLSFELNGIKLHEYYFENMTPRKGAGTISKTSRVYKKIVNDFGSYEKWHKNLKGIALMRGVGWAVVTYDPSADLVINTWVELHHIGHVVGCVPLLVLDVWEHALLLDYGSNRKDYIDAFFEIIDWEKVDQRFESALTA